ncbi:MAG: glycosyltransferase family protein, partial [Planctomycetota bacterium]
MLSKCMSLFDALLNRGGADRQRQGRPPIWPLAAIVAAGVLVYLNSFQGVFVFDDHGQIVDNQKIRSFDHLWGNRPLVRLSLAVNYHFGELNVWGYHLVNLVIHLLAGLTLYGIVRRVLLLEPFRRSCAQSAHWFALIIALVWVVHPLQTESVTYIIQRAESMMGLFYLLTIYCVLRGSTAPRPPVWYAAAVLACALGMASKPVMVTAPIVALLFDWAILSGSIRRTLRRRWPLYAGLASTWVLLVATGTTELILSPDSSKRPTAGFGYVGCTPLEYALTQPGVILRYLRLAIWPHPLCLDYGWPIARAAGNVLLPGVLIVTMAGVSVWSFLARKQAWIGFLGLSFFLILSPTSSIVPFAHPAFEHRMYLPLAAVVTVLVFGSHYGFRWFSDRIMM